MDTNNLSDELQSKKKVSDDESSADRQKQKEDLAKILAAFQRDKDRLKAAESVSDGAFLEFKRSW